MILEDESAHAAILGQPREVDGVDGAGDAIRVAVSVDIDDAVKGLGGGRGGQQKRRDQEALHGSIVARGRNRGTMGLSQ
jgi:hypothetical protein